MAYFIFIALCLMFSISFLLMKKAALGFSPAAVGFGRVFGGAIFLLLFFLLRKERRTLLWRDTAPILLVAIFGYAWPFYIQPEIIGRVGSGYMSVIVSLVPLLTILFSAIWLRIKPSPRQMIGAAGALACLAVLNWQALSNYLNWRDLLLAVTVPIGYAATNICAREHLSERSQIEMSGVSLAIASIVLAPMAFWSKGPVNVDPATFWYSLAAIATLGIVHAGISSWLFYQLVRDHGPLFAGMMTNVVPIGAVLFGWLDGEPFTAIQAFALAGVLAMVALVQIGSATSPVLLKGNDPDVERVS